LLKKDAGVEDIADLMNMEDEAQRKNILKVSDE